MQESIALPTPREARSRPDNQAEGRRLKGSGQAASGKMNPHRAGARHQNHK